MTVAFPDRRTLAPGRIRVVVRDPVTVETAGQRRSTPVRAPADAELARAFGGGATGYATGGG